MLTPDSLEFIAPLIATFALGGFTLAGLKMYWGYKTRRLEIEEHRSSPKIDEGFDELRSEMQALRTEVGELHERIDFAERLLARGQADVHGSGREG